MQKVVIVTCYSEPKGAYGFNEVKEVNALLDKGYKVVSVTVCPPPKEAFHGTFLLVLQKD